MNNNVASTNPTPRGISLPYAINNVTDASQDVSELNQSSVKAQNLS